MRRPIFELALQLLRFLLESLVSSGSFSSCDRGLWLDGFFEMPKLACALSVDNYDTHEGFLSVN